MSNQPAAPQSVTTVSPAAYSYVISISEGPVMSSEQFSVAAASSATAAVPLAALPAPIAAGTEEVESDDNMSLWGSQPSTQSNASNRPWLSPSRFLSLPTQSFTEAGTQTTPRTQLNNETQTPPFERTWSPPYRMWHALEYIGAASAAYLTHTPLQLAHVVYRWLNLSTNLDWYFLSALVEGIVSAERQLTSSLLATVSAARSLDPTGLVAMATVAAELARRSARPDDDGGLRFEPELHQIMDAVINIE